MHIGKLQNDYCLQQVLQFSAFVFNLTFFDFQKRSELGTYSIDTK